MAPLRAPAAAATGDPARVSLDVIRITASGGLRSRRAVSEPCSGRKAFSAWNDASAAKAAKQGWKGAEGGNKDKVDQAIEPGQCQMNESRPTGSFRLPSVDRVLRTPTGGVIVDRFGHEASVAAIRKVLGSARAALRTGGELVAEAAVIATQALSLLESDNAPSLRRVFNLTGTVLHTNLGRAVLPETAIAAAAAAMRSAVALEFDVEGARRGERDDHVRNLVRELTGAEDVAIVNNNAGAVLLVVNTFGADREAVVSRGELIEIGGAFRLPEIMVRAGARLIEIGTTNRTHLSDYEQAIGENTGLILKAHTSNYLIQGFTTSVPAPQLARLTRSRNVPFVHDLGSGAIVDLARYGV